MKFDSAVKFLLEMARSGYLYHYNTNAIESEMFINGHFKLSSLYDDAERDRAPDCSYFLSCSRIPRAGYNWEMSEKFPHTIFQLDANRISYNYKIIPVNASHTDKDTVLYHSERHKDENEDRILSRKDKIPFKGNVVAVHQFIPKFNKNNPYSDRAHLDNYKRIFKTQMIPCCKENNISLYVYDDVAALGHLDIRKAKKVV